MDSEKTNILSVSAVAVTVLVGIFGGAFMAGGWWALLPAALLFLIQVEQAQKTRNLQEEVKKLREFVTITEYYRDTVLGKEVPPSGGPDAEAN